MSKMGSHCSFGHLKHKLLPKEGPGVEFPGVRQFWLPTTKSRESTRNTWLQKTCDIPLKRSRRDLQLCFRRWVDRRSTPKVMKPQSRGSPGNARFRDSHAGVPGVPGQNGHLDATPATSHRVYYKGEGGGFPKSGPWWMQMSLRLPVALPSIKGASTMHYHFMRVLCKPVWVSEACQFFLVPSRSSNTPLYPSSVVS
jgi:hypothetical protein